MTLDARTVTILMGIFASTVFDFTLQAAEALLDPVMYIQSVMNGN